MRRRWWVVLVLVFAVALAGAGVALRERRLHRLAPTGVGPEPFAAWGWHSGSATRRVGMGYHLAGSGELVGLTRDELVARLGPPSAERDRGMEWFLGERESSASMMFPYREHLGVLLDERGVCVRAAVSTRD